ncbi:MAG: hypothetical protein GY913_33995 [Proteobacteria bacterium]|nr:hypothetical protein [Pseudomonadota bacterium]
MTLLTLILACDEAATTDETAALQAQLDTLERLVEEQAAQLEAQTAHTTELEDELAAWTGGVDLTELADTAASNASAIDALDADLVLAEDTLTVHDTAIAGNSTDLLDMAATHDADVVALSESLAADATNTTDLDTVEADYLVSADLTGLATEVWVAATDLADLSSDVAAHGSEIDDNAADIDAIETDYLVAADISGFATEVWVAAQGYATDADLSSLETDVSDNASDIATNLADIATNVVDIATNLAVIDAIEADYLTAADISGFATETWVEAKGYATDTDLTSLEGDVDAIEADYVASAVSDLENDLQELNDWQDTAERDIDQELEELDDNLDDWQDEVEDDLDDLMADDTLVDLLDYLTVDTTAGSVVFDSANVYIQSGSGTSDGTVNGLGNLIVGYDEDDGSDTKTGSHNLVMGVYQGYSSYGGLVHGHNNELTGEDCAAVGTLDSLCSGEVSAVFGGEGHEAGGTGTAILGGYYNTADNNYNVVAGGTTNAAEAWAGAVFGGYQNDATGEWISDPVVVGGRANEASHTRSVILGGTSQTTSATGDVIY